MIKPAKPIELNRTSEIENLDDSGKLFLIIINKLNETIFKLNEIIATVNEQEKKIDFIMENTDKEFYTENNITKPTLKELYEKR